MFPSCLSQDNCVSWVQYSGVLYPKLKVSVYLLGTRQYSSKYLLLVGTTGILVVY